MNDGPEDVAKALDAIGRIEVAPTLLAVLCEINGMRFSAVACVTETTWTACAVQDEIGFGVRRGDQLARAHKGSISVASSQMDGTQFTPRLPLGVSQRINSSILTTAPDANQRGYASRRASREAVVHIPS